MYINHKLKRNPCNSKALKGSFKNWIDSSRRMKRHQNKAASSNVSEPFENSHLDYLLRLTKNIMFSKLLKFWTLGTGRSGGLTQLLMRSI